MVFTEFVELVEQRFGAELLDDVLDEAGGDHDGAYTAVGNYDHQELVALVVALAQRVGTDPAELVHAFGLHLSQRFVETHRNFFDSSTDAFAFLMRVDDTVHVAVRKLYAEADPPSLHAERLGPRTLRLVYESERRLGDLAQGLIEGCAEHYGERLLVERLTEADGAREVFTIQRSA